jgi:hypothetical protein
VLVLSSLPQLFGGGQELNQDQTCSSQNYLGQPQPGFALVMAGHLQKLWDIASQSEEKRDARSREACICRVNLFPVQLSGIGRLKTNRHGTNN